MIALDSNVLACAIAVKSDADAVTKIQCTRAQALLSSSHQLCVPITVIEELEWVLRGAYGMPTDEIATLVEDMRAVENLTVDRAAAASQAIAWYRQGRDFSDTLHLAQSGLCNRLATFDTRFSKAARRLGLEPPVSAPR